MKMKPPDPKYKEGMDGPLFHWPVSVHRSCGYCNNEEMETCGSIQTHKHTSKMAEENPKEKAKGGLEKSQWLFH